MARCKQQNSGATSQMADARNDTRSGAPGLVALIRQMILELHLLLRTKRGIRRVVVVRRVLLRAALRIEGGASGHRANRKRGDRAAGDEVRLPVVHPILLLRCVGRAQQSIRLPPDRSLESAEEKSF